MYFLIFPQLGFKTLLLEKKFNAQSRKMSVEKSLFQDNAKRFVANAANHLMAFKTKN